MAVERNELPGRPSAKLVADVRRILRRYVQCRPERRNPIWMMTWEWANTIASRSASWLFAKHKRRYWPSGNEIATQFLLLSLIEMRASCQLKMPVLANEYMPDRVKGFIAENDKLLAIIKGPRLNRKHQATALIGAEVFSG